MIFLIPFLIFVFILLLISKLAGATLSWFIVLLPLIISIIFIALIQFFAKKQKLKIKNKK